MPFVLLSQPTAVHESSRPDVAAMAVNAHGRYSQIMKDVEDLILDHIAHQRSGTGHASKLKLLVPSVGTFFTPLPLQDAFNYQDAKRCISSRRFVPPSFNDIRLVLNTAQAMTNSLPRALPTLPRPSLPPLTPSALVLPLTSQSSTTRS